MTILAFDLGSTNLKAALFDEKLQRISEYSVPAPYSVRERGRVEFSPTTFHSAFQKLSNKVQDQCNGPQSKPDVISITSQAQTFILVDKEINPVTPFISWMDTRAKLQSDRFAQFLGDDFHLHCTFPEPIPELALCKLAWLHENYPEIVQKTRYYVPLPSWIAYQFGASINTDSNLAGMSGCFDLQTNTWWESALEFTGMKLDQMPSLVLPGCRLPTDSKLEIVLAGNDQTCNAYAANLQPGEILVSLGTAIVVYHLPVTKADLSSDSILGHWPSTNRPWYPKPSWGPFPGGKLYELAVLPTEKFNLHSKSDAVLEKLSFLVKQTMFSSLKIDGLPIRLKLTGGGSQNDQLLQILANVLACEVVKINSDALQGAALLTNQFQPEYSPQKIKNFLPNPELAYHYQLKYSQWLSKFQKGTVHEGTAHG